MTLVPLRQSIVDSIDAEIPAFKSVEPHGGSFNRKELLRVATKSPACLVAVLGGSIERQSGVAVANPSIFAFIVTRGSSQTKRDEDALVLAQAVASLAVENKWNSDDAKAPDGMRMENLYSGDIDSLGVALWAVSWTQQVDLEGFDASTLGYFETMKADYDLAPADGVIDFEQLIQVGGGFMSAYGQLYISTAAATAIATPDTYQKAAGTTTLKLNEDTDMPTDMRLRHTGTVSKPFLATASISVEVATDAKVTLAFAKGGVVDEDDEIEQDIVAAAGAEAFSLKHIVSLDANEYVEVWVKCDSAINVTLTKASVVLAAT